MKLTKYILYAAAPLLLVSCMDTEPLGNTLTSKQKEETVEQNPERLEASVASVSAAAYQINKIRATSHSDFGIPAIMLHLDTRGVDMVSKDLGYNWFGFSLTYDNVDYTYGNDREIWGTFYNQILACNSLAKQVDPDTDNPELQYYLAQALGTRAYDYFNLVQIYQQTYSKVDREKALGVPLITEANQDQAAVNGAPRATVEQVYAQVLSDLDKAIELFDASGVTRSSKRYLDGVVARALRAKVYLVMNRWSEAAADAQYVIAHSGAKPTPLSEVGKPSFSDINEANWLWGIDAAETDDAVASGLINWPSHLCSLSYGYASYGAWKSINKKLYESIPATDERKKWFCDAELNSAGLTAEQHNFLVEKEAPAYVNVKFAPYKGVLNQSTNANDYPLLRIEEMYYILAEAQGMAGDVAAGVQTLQNFVRTYRNPSYTVSAGNAATLQEAVFQQRRIEFWGEGNSWFDYIRLGKNFDRRGGGFEASTCYNIPAGDPALIWPIPFNEIQYNKGIKDTDNNPFGTKPTPVPDN